jgi:DNA-binding NtrC family response regulator
MILRRRGFLVETAANGIDAIDKFKEHSYDVTLMDVVMPDMNGVEAFRQIKALEPDTPVILMTAYSDEELIETAKTEGIKNVINKPVHIDKLIELLTETTAGEPILVVDDDEDIRLTMTHILEQEGHRVLTAGSGEEAIDILKKQVCLMAFIDIKLPNIDGLETLLRLKEINPRLRTVMMTGFKNEVREALEKAQQSAAITCLYKPFDPSEAADIANRVSAPHRSRRTNAP